jgi:hypothetical protein
VSAIPLADARSLRLPARRTSLVRIGLGAIAVAAAIVAALVARQPHTRTIVPLPTHADTVIVLDLSASISSDTFYRIGGTLSALARSGRRFGLVIFSDQAYEALPPGTPAADLAPLVRYFTLPKQKRPGFLPQFPANPWQRSFSGGTRISQGMELAHRIALSGNRRAAVVLVSDLDDDPHDLPDLASVLVSYRRDRIPVRVVALNPTLADVLFFQRLLEPSPVIVQAPTLDQAAPHDVTPFPWTFVALAVAAAAALALREAWAPVLDWARS